MTPIKRISRASKEVRTTYKRYAAQLEIGHDIGDSESAFAVACYRWLNAAPDVQNVGTVGHIDYDIETEAEKRAKKFLKVGMHKGFNISESIGIIRALLRERGKI